MAKMPTQKPGRSKQNYRTPKNLIAAILKRLAITGFAWDLAADRHNTLARFFWGEADDSLSKGPIEWAHACSDGWGWLNPPFANIAKWAFCCLDAMHTGANIAFLVPASVGSNWYRDFIHDQPGVTVLFLNGRPSFDGIAGFPKDCMLVLFNGSSPETPFTTEVWTWK